MFKCKVRTKQMLETKKIFQTYTNPFVFFCILFLFYVKNLWILRGGLFLKKSFFKTFRDRIKDVGKMWKEGQSLTGSNCIPRVRNTSKVIRQNI